MFSMLLTFLSIVVGVCLIGVSVLGLLLLLFLLFKIPKKVLFSILGDSEKHYKEYSDGWDQINDDKNKKLLLWIIGVVSFISMYLGVVLVF